MQFLSFRLCLLLCLAMPAFGLAQICDLIQIGRALFQKAC